ncbi:hypothetical protein JGG50_25680, partial [Salmonella enterica subsp. enterica serovar Typhimurium]|nr:hypothetical protein [Salmonella enterica subsp. enterica serovar Typhimurium]
MLNIDYKILSSILCDRLATVVAPLIGRTQTCSLRGRSITESVRLIRDLCIYISGREMRIAAIAVDQNKAFDRVSHQCLEKLLLRHGCGEFFTGAVACLYRECSGRIVISG